MKSFEEFYNQELKPAVDNLEKERKKILSWSIFGFLFLMFGLFVVFSYFADASVWWLKQLRLKSFPISFC